MSDMLFGKQYEEYTGEDLSHLIGDEWSECECGCPSKCEDCACAGESK